MDVVCIPHYSGGLIKRVSMSGGTKCTIDSYSEEKDGAKYTLYDKAGCNGIVNTTVHDTAASWLEETNKKYKSGSPLGYSENGNLHPLDAKSSAGLTKFQHRCKTFLGIATPQPGPKTTNWSAPVPAIPADVKGDL